MQHLQLAKLEHGQLQTSVALKSLQHYLLLSKRRSFSSTCIVRNVSVATRWFRSKLKYLPTTDPPLLSCFFRRMQSFGIKITVHAYICYCKRTFGMRYTALALNFGSSRCSTVVTDWDVPTVDGKIPLYVPQGRSVQAASPTGTLHFVAT